MKDNLVLVNDLKKTILYLDKVIQNFPRIEKVLRDKINNTGYEVLELIYFSNLLDIDQRVIYQKRIISKIKMLDFYFKISCDKKYISYKKYMKVGNFLLNMIKQLYGWIKYEKTKLSSAKN